MPFHRYISDTRKNETGSSHRMVEVRYTPKKEGGEAEAEKPLPKSIKELEKQRWKQQGGS